jgi:DNA-binding transcriptional LysR family regulator
MNYTLQQLKIYLKVCKLKSITRASEEMFMTQPAVSIQVKKFQEQFDIPLTQLIGKKITITDFGEEIAIACQRTIDEAENIANTSANYKGLLAGKISISVVSTGKYIIPYFISDFIKKHRQIKFSIDVSNRTQVLENLKKNNIDLALVSVLPTDIDYESIELMKNELYMVGIGVTNQPKEKENLAELPMIFREQGSATRTAMETFFNNKKITAFKSLELVSNEAVKQAVCAGLGYSIMPLIGVSRELNNNRLSIYPVDGLPITTSWNLIYPVNKKKSPALAALINHIEKNKEETIKEHFPEIDISRRNKRA